MSEVAKGWEGYVNNLRNRLYGLLCEFEKDGEWEKFLDSLIIEFEGFQEEHRTIDYYKLLHKLYSLRYVKYKYFRSIVFECMGLLSGVR